MTDEEVKTMIPDGEALTNEEEQELLAKLDASLIKPSDEFEEPDYTVEQNGVGFAPKGNIMALMAEMKHGKTFVNTSLACAVIKGEFLGIRGLLKDPKVIFFDTEQDKADGQRIQRRVQYVNGWDFKDDESHKDQFKIYHFREYPFDLRTKLVEVAIKHYKPDVVFIDGIRDLIQDFNSLEEAAGIIQLLMELSSKYHCAIWTVLHVNPNSDKMRGHLGTELGNKTTDVLRVTKHKDKNSGLVSFEVEHVAARHRDIDGWEFKIDDDKPYGIPTLMSEQDQQTMTEAKIARKEELRAILSKYIHEPLAISKTKLRDAIKAGENYGSSKAWKIVEEAIGLEVIEQVIGGKYRMKNQDTDAQQQDMPF